MTIVFNSDKNIEIHTKQTDYYSSYIKDQLDRFSDHITRIEVHFSDENAGKTGPEDKRCVLEARLQKRQPIAVTANNNTVEQALFDAVAKMKNALNTYSGKLKSH